MDKEKPIDMSLPCPNCEIRVVCPESYTPGSKECKETIKAHSKPDWAK